MNMNDPIASLLGSWATELNLYSVLLRVAVSVVFAAMIGCERASKRHAAGQRTFILVSLASTMAMLLDQRGRAAGLRRGGDRHRHHQQQLDSLQLQKPDQGADDLGGALGLRRDRPDHRRGAVYGFRHRLCGADVLPGAVPDV